mgnify:CR=1 FL=1
MSEFIFDNLKVSHSKQVFILQKKYKKEFGNNIWKTEELKRSIENNALVGNVFIVDKVVMGFCFFKKIDNYLEIYSLFVDPLYRKKGIAANFVGLCIKYCQKNMLKKIILDVNEKNIRAINFYKKSNFTFCGKRKDYYKVNNSFDDSFTMNLIL